MPKPKKKSWGGRKSRRICKATRRPYGLARDARGRKDQKFAVLFYDTFCKPRWEDRLKPPIFEIARRELEIFFEQCGLLSRLPKTPEPTKAEQGFYTEQLGVLRARLNEAASNGEGIKKAPNVDWGFVIEPLVIGKIYQVMPCETRAVSGKEEDRVASFAEAQRRKIKKIHQGILEKNHTEQEMDAYSRNFEVVNDHMQHVEDSADEARLKQFAIEDAMKKKRIGGPA